MPAFESMMGILQPQQGSVLTITTGADGVASDRVVSRLDDNGRTFVSANPWPRAWYREALANPDVQVTIDGVRREYRAVPIEEASEHERLDTAFAHPLAFRIITGFPPRRSSGRSSKNWRSRRPFGVSPRMATW